MYKRYQGNSGRVEWVEDRPGAFAPPPPPPPLLRPSAQPLGGLGDLLRRFLPGAREALETEDLLLLLILYLLYRESGDRELLIMMGAMFLLP